MSSTPTSVGLSGSSPVNQTSGASNNHDVPPPSYPQTNSLAFVVNPLPSTDEQLNERILETAEKLRNEANATNLPIVSNVVGGNSTSTNNETNAETDQNQVNVQQCIIGNGYVAILTQDNRVFRFPFNIYSERMNSSTSTGTNLETSTPKNLSSSSSHRGGITSPSIVSSSSARTSSTAQNARRRLIRSSARARTSTSVIMGRSHIIPAQFVPEDLINQAQVVLQGKSRNVIIRELQRTNLDVNLAVNNLLSRDDEEFDDGDEGPEQMIQSDDLMSLLDSGFPNDSVIIDSDFNDEVFTYPLRIRSGGSALFSGSPSGNGNNSASGTQSSGNASSTGSGSSVNNRPRLREDTFFMDRDIPFGTNKSRGWYASYSDLHKELPGRVSKTTKSNETNLQFAPISFYDQQQEFWPNSQDRRYIAIASTYSELIAITTQGQLCQWRWQDAEPFKAQALDGTVYYHPKVLSLGLLQEKITLLSASCIRASVATESGKVATWIDESISPITTKLEHPATLITIDPSYPATGSNSHSSIRITSLHVSSFMSCVQLSNGGIYWWGIPPFSHRKKLIEKVKNDRTKSNRTKSAGSTPFTASSSSGNNSSSSSSKESEIVQGALVCMRSCPIYQNGSIGFTTVGGVPKVGQLVNSAWKITDSCSFRVLSPAEIQSRTQTSSSSSSQLSRQSQSTSATNLVNKEQTFNVDGTRSEMPPPPSPASSTSSEPGYVPPLPKRAKRSSANSSSSSGTGNAAGTSAGGSNSSSSANFNPEPNVQQQQSSSIQQVSNKESLTNDRVENWNLKDVVFMEDVKNMPIGRVIKVDGNYVAVKFNQIDSQQKSSSTSTSSGAFDFSFENYMQDCRLMRKDELSVFKSLPNVIVPNQSALGGVSGNNFGTKAYDCLQRYPKKVNLPEHIQIYAMTLTNLGLHCIAKIGGYRFSYILINIVTGRIEQDSKISIDSNTFLGKTASPKLSKVCLFSTGESETTTVVICRDGNGTLYPLAKDCTETVLREPIALNLGPVSTIGLGIYALPSSMIATTSSGSSSSPKTHAAILGLAFEPQYLMSAILKSDLDVLRERLDLASKFPQYQSMLNEVCDGNRNIIHIAVSACFPTTNRPNSSQGHSQSNHSSGSIIVFDPEADVSNERSHDSYFSNASNEPQQQQQSSNAMNDSTVEPATAEPLLDPTEQKPIAHSILWTLLDSPVLSSYCLLNLLSSKDFQGYTPFMLAVAGRAYSAANQLFIIIQKVARNVCVANNYPITSSAYNSHYKQMMMQMLYPRNSLPDHSPLYMLCSNDTCSFTWTGEEHINQDIFECRTCGLVGSLCCCTECARVCHRGHDCKLKRTSPTAYCDCWEKCKCKALIGGCQPARYMLLQRLLTYTDLSLRVNSRGEHILLFLVQTVGRQIVEQKQYRPNRLRTSNNRNKNDSTNEDGTTIPEHDLEPPKFTRRALEKILIDWPTVKSMIMTGYRASEDSQNKRRFYLRDFFNGTTNAYAYEEENAYLGRQNGSALLDKFTHSLLRIGLEMIEKLIITLQMACNNQYPDAKIVSRRFIRSVARVGLVVCFELNPTLYASHFTPSSGLFCSLMERALGGSGSNGIYSSIGGPGSSSSQYNSSSSSALKKTNSALSILSKCRRIFLSFLPIAIEELCEIAESLIAPVKFGVARPGNQFVLSPTSNEVLASTDEIFSVDTSIYAHQRDFLDSELGVDDTLNDPIISQPPPPPPSQPSASVSNVISGENLPNFSGAFDAAIRSVENPNAVLQRNNVESIVDQMETESVSAELAGRNVSSDNGGNAPGNSADVIGAAHEDISSEPPPSMDSDDPFQRREDVIMSELLLGIGEHDEENSNVGGRDTESDSESNPDDGSYLSNADNASMAQRSVVTGATAGSDVGVSSLPYDDESINSNGEDVDDDDDDDQEGDDNDDDDDENSDASDTAETEPETEEMAFLDEHVERRLGNNSNTFTSINSSSVTGNSSTNAGSNAGGPGSASSNNRSNVLHHVQWALRQRDTSGANSVAPESGFRRSTIPSLLVSGENVVSMSNSSVGLARAFSIVVRQISDLMPLLRDPSELKASNFPYLPFTPYESLTLQQTVEARLGGTWKWLIKIMDSTESQLRFGCSLSNRRLTTSGTTPNSANTSAATAASISNAVAFSSSHSTGSNAVNSATNTFRRLRAFQNNDDMLFLPISRNSTMRRMSGLGLGRHPSSSNNGTGGSSGATGTSSSNGNGTGNASSSTALVMDSNSARRDFLNYAMSLMRAHSNEHYDSLPVLDVASLKHLAYVFDSFIYYVRRGLIAHPSHEEDSFVELGLASQDIGKSEVMTAEANKDPASRVSRFFRRSNSTLFLGCPPPDPISAPFHEALPLASKPHLLKPSARREQLFGVPRPSNTAQAEEMIESLPSQLSLSSRLSTTSKTNSKSTVAPQNVQSTSSGTSSTESGSVTTVIQQAVTPSSRPQSVIFEPTVVRRSTIIQSPPSKQSVIVMRSSETTPTRQAINVSVKDEPEDECKEIRIFPTIACGTSPQTVIKQETVDQSQETQPDFSEHYAKFYYGNQSKHDSLLGRWRLSLELFGRIFVDDVGLEPNSIMTELSGFPIKETKFRREMERLRNQNSSSNSSSSNTQRDISFHNLNRDRCLLMSQTFKELNSVFNHGRRISSQNQSLAITRVKVTFKDEPGEGTGVARSFYTAFAEAVLANEKLTNMDWLSNASAMGSGQRVGPHYNSFPPNFQYNLIRVTHGSLAGAVVSALGGPNQSGNGQRGTDLETLRGARSPSRVRMLASSYRRTHMDRIRNEIRSNYVSLTSAGVTPPPVSGGPAVSNVTTISSPSLSSSPSTQSTSGTTRSRNSSDPPVTLRYDSAPFVPPQHISSGSRFGQPSFISNDSRLTLGNRIYARVLPLQPHHAAKITGMLLDLPTHDLIPIITSEIDFRNHVEHAAEIINAAENPGSEQVVPPSSMPQTPPSTSASSATITETEVAEGDDDAPLFYQPGPRGFYTPRAGRATEVRLNAFRNIGRIMGICFVQNELCPITLNRHVIKLILGRPVSWHDLAFYDSDLYESLRQLILDAESNSTESNYFNDMDFRFIIDRSAEEGSGQEVELIPNGNKIRVGSDNIRNYVRHYALHRMVTAQLPAIQAIRAGIFDVVPAKSFDGLTAEDFRLLLNGVNDINIQLLQSYVTFHDESGNGSEHLSYFRRWFWWVVERMTIEEKQDLVYFWTGSPALPASEEGFQPLPSITIRPREDNYYVTANTCISRLYIPLYSSRNILRQRLLVSIKSKSFGFI